MGEADRNLHPSFINFLTWSCVWKLQLFEAKKNGDSCNFWSRPRPLLVAIWSAIFLIYAAKIFPAPQQIFCSFLYFLAPPSLCSLKPLLLYKRLLQSSGNWPVSHANETDVCHPRAPSLSLNGISPGRWRFEGVREQGRGQHRTGATSGA